MPTCTNGRRHRWTRQAAQERDDLVMDLALDVTDSGHVDPGVLPDARGGVPRHLAHARQGLRGQNLDLQPLAEAVLLGPYLRHLGAGVTLDHLTSRGLRHGYARIRHLVRMPSIRRPGLCFFGAGVAETARVTRGCRKLVHFFPTHPRNALNHHLSYSISGTDGHRFRAQVDDSQLNLAPVVRIDGCRGCSPGSRRASGQGRSAGGSGLRNRRAAPGRIRRVPAPAQAVPAPLRPPPRPPSPVPPNPRSCSGAVERQICRAAPA